MERSELQFSMRSLFVLVTGAALLFAAGRAFGAIPVVVGLGIVGITGVLFILFESPAMNRCLRFFLAKAGIVLSKVDNFQIAIFVAVFLAAVASRLIEWSLWHSAGFVFAVAMLVYSIAVWLGAEVSVPLDTPVIGIPLIIAFFTILWWAHFGPYGDARLVTMTMAVLAFSPFVALTFQNLVGLN